jgi:argininosuccinate lyase
MKLWQKSFEMSKEIETFTVGKDREMDIFLAPHDILGSIAHITMLETIQLLTPQELTTLKKELITLYQETEQGNFVIEEGVEDVHSQVELMLTRRLGEIGKKIHSGRSRNDQVLLDLKLFIRKEIENTVYLVKSLFDTLIELSEKYKQVLIPGYTHYQIAMPSSFGLWFGAYAESLIDDLITLQAAYRVANKNPLGSAAGYGSSFPLNRTLTTQLLGFEQLNVNVVYAQMGRGKTERIVAQAMANIAATLAKLAQDVCLYISQNFGFISFPNELTTGSSIMPHKKNPDVFELVRAKSNKIMALPNEITLITANLASGYHRDLQLIKENFIPAFAELNNCLNITNYAISQIIIKENIIEDKRYEHLFSVEVANDLVLKGTAFRDAYRIVAEQIENNTFNPPKEIKHTHEGSIGNLQNNVIVSEMEKVLKTFPFEQVQQALNKLFQMD